MPRDTKDYSVFHLYVILEKAKIMTEIKSVIAWGEKWGSEIDCKEAKIKFGGYR